MKDRLDVTSKSGWTSAFPSKPGYYWMRHEGEDEVVRVHHSCLAVSTTWGDGRFRKGDCEDWGWQFNGPIEVKK